MKTLLLYPPTILDQGADGAVQAGPAPPLALAMLAPALYQAGLDVELLDATGEGFVTAPPDPGVELHHVSKGLCRTNSLSPPLAPGTYTLGLGTGEILDRVRSAAADVVGISIPCASLHPVAGHMASLIKSNFPWVRVVAGGGWPSASPAEVLADGSVDYVVMGEGERSFVELLRRLEEERFTEVCRVPGVCFMDRFAGLVLNPPVPIEDLDGLPFADYGGLPLESYFRASETGRTLGVLSSRGCWAADRSPRGDSDPLRRFRARSPGSVISEVESLARDHSLDGIIFEDDAMTLDPGRAREIFRLMAGLRHGLRLYARGFRAGLLDREMLDLMAGAGFETVWIRQGSEYDDADRGSELRRVVRDVRLIGEAGLEAGVSFTIGIPGDTMTEVRETVECARKLKRTGVRSFRVSMAARASAERRMACAMSWDDFNHPAGRPAGEGFEAGEARRLALDLMAELNVKESAA
ncbi:MAG: B12-binding domain-containing radical SAM protein [Thermodesulfobacteriota bacterium]